MMTDQQQIFMLFFAVLFGVMLSLFTEFGPFQYHRWFRLCKSEIRELFGRSDYRYLSDAERVDAQNMVKCKRRRVVLSFVVLNLLPFVYFIFIYHFALGWLSDIKVNEISISFFSMFSALSIFGFYRFYKGLIICWKESFFLDRWFSKDRSWWKMEEDDWILEFWVAILFFIPLWIVFLFKFPFVFLIIMVIILLIFLFYDC